MNEAQRHAWSALGIGPAWVARPASADATPRPAELPAGSALEPYAPEFPAVSVADPGAAETPPGSAIEPRAPAILDWPALREAVAGCVACRLCESRRNTVFGVGDQQAHWMVIGEAPGAEEDRRGEPFVGKAGQLLDAMLAAVGRSRRGDGGVFIANVLKCRPPGNRDPQPDEAARCSPFLQRQIELVAPRVIVALGRVAAQSLLATEASLASLRGRVHDYASAGGRIIPLVATYHPAYLLRTPVDKSKAWVDLQLAQRVARRPGTNGSATGEQGDARRP